MDYKSQIVIFPIKKLLRLLVDEQVKCVINDDPKRAIYIVKKDSELQLYNTTQYDLLMLMASKKEDMALTIPTYTAFPINELLRACIENGIDEFLILIQDNKKQSAIPIIIDETVSVGDLVHIENKDLSLIISESTIAFHSLEQWQNCHIAGLRIQTAYGLDFHVRNMDFVKPSQAVLPHKMSLKDGENVHISAFLILEQEKL